MDSDGLPIVGAGIDFTKVGAIHQKRTLAFLNHFITHTVHFLNQFSCVCEEKLEQLTIKMQRLETTMNILEAKLTSIPGLENVTISRDTQQDTSQDTTSKATENTTVTVEPSHPQTSVQNDNTPQTTNEDNRTEEPTKVAEEKPQMTVSQDPRYAKFFKMLQVGVPLMALRQKVLAEGLDPDYLENPNAPAPDGGSSGNADVGKESDDDEVEFSDDDNNDDQEDKSQNDDDDDSSSGFSD